jgi:hypothetical protein
MSLLIETNGTICQFEKCGKWRCNTWLNGPEMSRKNFPNCCLWFVHVLLYLLLLNEQKCIKMPTLNFVQNGSEIVK